MKNLILGLIALGSLSVYATEPLRGIINKKTGDSISIICAERSNDVCESLNIALVRKNSDLPVSYINSKPIQVEQLDSLESMLDSNKWGEYKASKSMFRTSGNVFNSLGDTIYDMSMDLEFAVVALGPPVAIGMGVAGAGVAVGGAVTFVAETAYKTGRTALVGVNNLFVHGSIKKSLRSIKNNEGKKVSNRKFKRMLKFLEKSSNQL